MEPDLALHVGIFLQNFNLKFHNDNYGEHFAYERSSIFCNTAGYQAIGIFSEVPLESKLLKKRN